MKDIRFEMLKAEFGSLYRLCQILGLTTNAVYQWRRNNTVPLKYLKKLEELSEGRITRKQMRPDIFGE